MGTRPLGTRLLAAHRPAVRLLSVPAFAVALGLAVGGCGDPSAEVSGPGSPGEPGQPTVTTTVARLTRATLGEQFTLAPGEIAKVAGSDVEVTFVEVSADSRCPATTECVWEGDGVVMLSAVITDPSSGPPWTPAAVELHTNPGFPTVAAVPRYTVTLVLLTPAPSTDELAQSSYRATLRVDAAR